MSQKSGKFVTFFITVLFLNFMSVAAYSQDDTVGNDPFVKFGEFTKDSDLVIHHEVWSVLLSSSVVVVPPSSKLKASTQNAARTGTKIKRGSSSPARFESNRVQFQYFDKEFMQLVSKYRHELEELPSHFPLKFFSRDEQLAYWLNLHNVVLFEELAKRYPISKLKRLRNGVKGKPSLWDQKLVTVEGVPLSLYDIQNNILIRHWKTPMVLYGLFQGTIGGPSLPNRAFTGVNVQSILQRSASEFINSNRGVRPFGNKTKVSMTYEWGKAAFPNWERDLARHLAAVAKPSGATAIRNASSFSPKLYDWSIADTKGGTLSAGPKISTAANFLAQGTYSGEANSNDAGIALTAPKSGGPGRGIVGIPGGLSTSTEWESPNLGIRGGMSSSAQAALQNGWVVPGAYDSKVFELLRELKEKMKDRQEGSVSSTECGPEFSCTPQEALDEDLGSGDDASKEDLDKRDGD